jgi:protein phosphatase 4 regulatory subunit 3
VAQWQHENRPNELAVSQIPNGSASPVVKPLVDYPDDDDDVMDTKPEHPRNHKFNVSGSGAGNGPEAPTTPTLAAVQSPPERLSEKRRREEEDDDELIKLSSGPKRRGSSVSSSSSAGFLRRRKGFSMEPTIAPDKGSNAVVTNTPTRVSGPKKIAISIGTAALKPVPYDSSPVHASSTYENRSKEASTNHYRDGGG